MAVLGWILTLVGIGVLVWGLVLNPINWVIFGIGCVVAVVGLLIVAAVSDDGASVIGSLIEGIFDAF